MKNQKKPKVHPERPAIGMPRVLRAHQPDREARAFLRLANLSMSLRRAEDYSLPKLRLGWRLTALALARNPPVGSVTEQLIDGPGGDIALRIFKPDNTQQLRPAFMWFFGGGFIIGDLDTADGICRGGPLPSLQVLVYPATELVEKFPSYAENAYGRVLLTDHAIQWIEQTLAPSLDTLDLLDPWYSPRRSPDLRGLAPAIVVSAGFDPIRDDGLDYAARLRAADVPVELLHYGASSTDSSILIRSTVPAAMHCSASAMH